MAIRIHAYVIVFCLLLTLTSCTPKSASKVEDPTDFYMALSVALDICTANEEIIFEDASQIPSSQLLNLAMFLISRENYKEEQWEDWSTTGIPLEEIEAILQSHLEVVALDPSQLESYDAQSGRIHRELGGYGGGRYPVLLEHRMDDDILTLVIGYGDDTGSNFYASKTYRYRLLPNDGYQLLSIQAVLP